MSDRCLTSVPRLFILKGVPRFCGGFSIREFQEGFKGTSRMFHGCFKGALNVV